MSWMTLECKTRRVPLVMGVHGHASARNVSDGLSSIGLERPGVEWMAQDRQQCHP